MISQNYDFLLPQFMLELAQVHWLRVIVDEGHMLGNSLHMTNKLQMACALRADRRWLMTGTPTPGGPNSDTAYLQPLLAFLHNEPYGTEASIWQVEIQPNSISVCDHPVASAIFLLAYGTCIDQESFSVENLGMVCKRHTALTDCW